MARRQRFLRWMLGTLYAACLLAGAAWASLQQQSQVAAAIKAIVAALAALVPVIGASIVAMSREQQQRRLNGVLEMSFRCWSARGGPRVADVREPRRLGVHYAALPTEVVAAETTLDEPTYVPRTQDELLEWALRSTRFVLLLGDSAAGKSRSAYEAMQRLFSDRLLLVPTWKASLPTLIGLGVRLPDCVIWLDELDRYLGNDGLNIDLLRRLTESTHGDVTLLASMRSAVWHGYSSESEVRKDERAVLLQARLVWLDRKLDDEERARAGNLSNDPRIAAALPRLERYGLAEYLAAGPALLERFQRAQGDGETCGAAIVRASVDWRRAGLLRPAPQAMLEKLYPHYLADPHPRHRSLEAFTTGLKWASQPIYGTMTPAMVLEVEERAFQAFDYLIDHFEKQPEHHQIPQSTWQLVAAELTDPVDLFDVGLSAYLSNEADVADRLWRRAAESGHTDAAHKLGALLQERGKQVEAEAWWRWAANAGHATAANILGALLLEQGKLEEAEAWWRWAAKAGHDTATNNLGALLLGQGKPEEAETWWRRAAGAGDANAAKHLGVLLQEQGKPEEAEAWWRRAAEAGDADAAANMGVLLEGQWKPEDAEAWYLRAAEADHAIAANNLGQLLKKKGRVDEAEAWFLRAAESGTALAAYNLGLLCHEQGRTEEAEAWFRRAAGAGYAGAAYNLWVLLKDQGKAAEAEAWYLRAANAADAADAAYNLGLLFQRQLRPAEAEAWFRRAAEAGHATAPYNLGRLLKMQGRTEEAEAWFRRADPLSAWSPRSRSR